MVSDSDNKFVCQNVDTQFKEAQAEIGKTQNRQTLHYNMKRREL